MFLIGSLSMLDDLRVLLHLDDFREENMVIMSIDGSPGPGGVRQLVDAKGMVKGKKTSVALGFNDEYWVKDILNALGTHGYDTIPVVYNAKTNHAIYGSTRDELRDARNFRFFKSLIFLVTPFVICVTLAISYHIKLKRAKEE